MASSFSLDLSRFAAKAAENANQAVRKIVQDVTGRVVARTPVDTGRARANWQISVGGLPTASVLHVGESAFSQGEGLKGKERTATVGQKRVANASAATAASMDAAKRAIASIKAGDTVFLANSLTYIHDLEYGSSRQAPEGMVRVTVQEFKAIVDAAVAEVNK